MINQRLVEARKEKSWSTETASARVKVSRVTYSRWENGHQQPRPTELAMLCEAFNLSAEDLGYGHLSKAPENKATPESQQSSMLMPSPEQITAFFNLLGSDAMKHQFDPAKRATLEKLLGVAGAAFLSPLSGLIHVENLLHDEEILSVCFTNIPIYWRLYFDGHLTEVSASLPETIRQLARLTEQPSPYQKDAASLASKAHQLACMLALQPQNFKSAMIHTDQAIQYARFTENPNLLVASLVRKALVNLYLKRPEQRLWAYQEAYQYIGKVSPLLRGRVHMGLAEVHSELARLHGDSEHPHDALSFLEQTLKMFPEHPKDDPNFAYTHFSLPQGYAGLVHLNLNAPGKAWDLFIEIDRTIPVSIVPDRVEQTVRQAKTLVRLGDLQQSGLYLESAVNSANALGSPLRHRESFDIYQEMQAKWPNERYVKDLAELFPTALS